MPRHKIEGIDEKILLATIEVAGSTIVPNRYSTKEIARLCNISEYVIFSHFKTKGNLIAQTTSLILKIYGTTMRRALEKVDNFQDLFLALLDEALRYPHGADFCINYAHIFPRAKMAPDYESFRQDVKEVLDDLYARFPLKEEYDNDTYKYLLWSNLTRELVANAKLIIHREVPDTPEIRLAMAQNVSLGLDAYGKTPGSPF
jgi:AcrR family transcriptional regulator